MSRGLNNNSGKYRALQNYGSTSTSSSTEVDFSPTLFISLSENVAQSIQSVKSDWQQLEKINRIIGTSKDSQSTRDKVHQIQLTTNLKITTTSKDLKRLTDIVRRDHKQQRLQVEKLTSDFKNVVEKYSASQRQMAAKMKVFITNIQENEEGYEPNDDENSTSKLLQDQKTLERDITFDQSLLKEREMRVKQIEADVLDVNTIMKEISSIINYQGEVIDDIAGSIEIVSVEVNDGNAQLQIAVESQSKYRRKVFILLVIAVIIGLILTGIIISQLKS